MSVDLRQALRLVLSLTNPSRMQAARWGEARLDTKQALRLVLSLTNPSALHGARWMRMDSGKCIFGKHQHRRDSQAENAS